MPFATLRRFPRGALIVQAGARADAIYLVQRGKVRVYLLGENGEETTTCILGDGQIFGIARLLGKPAYHAFVEALTPVEALSLPADRLLAHLPSDPALLAFMVCALSRRLTMATELLGDVALLPVARRLSHVSSLLSHCLGEESPTLPKNIIASLIGTRPETLSRAEPRRAQVA